MATVAPPSPTPPPARARPVRDPLSSWTLRQRAAYVLCWAAGLLLCVVAAAIVLLMAFKGISYLSLDLLTSRPEPGIAQSDIGGILDPLGGTVLLTVIGILIATPLGVLTAIWLVEYGRPAGLARAVESGIEVVAGTPDIVIAIFGLAIFQLPILGPLSFTAEGGGVFGRSFFAAGAMMSLIALPLVFGATREGLMAVPAQLRESSWALGQTKIATVREVVLPLLRRDIAAGATLGMGRIVGDTAVVVVLLGGSLRLEPEGTTPVLDVLRGTGSTLTTYVYGTSPAGEGNAPQKAYAAAFVLLIVVLALNFAVDRISRRGPRLEQPS